jgi:hypothetical protein
MNLILMRILMILFFTVLTLLREWGMRTI